MNITELVGRAHDNAVKHGFWDPPLDFGTAIALIHSDTKSPKAWPWNWRTL